MYVSIIALSPDSLIFINIILKTWEWSGDEATLSTCDFLLLSSNYSTYN